MMTAASSIDALPIPASLLGESPLWHPREQVLYWCDIPGRTLNRWDPASARHDSWDFETDVACCAAREAGGMLLALRTGVVAFDPATGVRTPRADAPYDPAVERFNDGKTDPQGRFWAGTIYEPRDPPNAALYRFDGDRMTRMADGITNSNGLAWSPDGRTMYWADTRGHRVQALDFDGATGGVSNRRTFVQFPVKQDGQDLSTYGGRPDGGAVDAEGCYWAAMFEGARLVRISPQGETVGTLALPVRCPTMACFGGADLRTLYITTSREKRPAEELAREPWAGKVLTVRVDVPGLPAVLARD